MRKLTLLLALVGAMVVLAVTSVIQAAVTTNDSATIPFGVFVPCANGGAGEFVSGSLELHTLVTSTVNGNNVSGKYHYQPQGSDLVGLTTGDTYQATGVTQGTFKGSLQNGQFNDTFVNNFRIIGQGPGNNFLAHQNTHVAVNANGDVTVTHDNLSIECK